MEKAASSWETQLDLRGWGSTNLPSWVYGAGQIKERTGLALGEKVAFYVLIYHVERR